MVSENTNRKLSSPMQHPRRAVEKADFVLLCARQYAQDQTITRLFRLRENVSRFIAAFERDAEEAALARARLSDDSLALRTEYESFTTSIYPMRMNEKYAALLPELQVDIATKLRYRLLVARRFENEYEDCVAQAEQALDRYQRTLNDALSASARRSFHRRAALSSSYALRDACVHAKREVMEKMPPDASEYRELRALVIRTRRPKKAAHTQPFPREYAS